MQKSFSTFPGGKFAIGLLILRLAAGIAAGYIGGIILSSLEPFIKNQILYASQLILALLLAAGSIFLIMGLMMPFVSITVTVCELIAAFMWLTPANPLEKSGFTWTSMLLLAGIAIALTFLGPGAISIDARLYGHQRVFLPPSKKKSQESQDS